MAEFPIQSSLNAGEISPELYGEVDLKKYSAAATTLRNLFVSFKGGAVSRGGLALVNMSRQPVSGTGPPQLVNFQFSINQGYALEMGDSYMRFIFRGGFVLEPAVTITGITRANPVVVSVSGTPFTNGDWVFFTGIVGMTQLNGLTMLVTGAASGHFSLTDLYGNTINSTTFSAYVSGGTVARLYTISTPYSAVDLPYLKVGQDADVMKLTCSNPVTGNEYPPYDLKRLASTNWTLAPTVFGASISPPSTVGATSSGLAAAGGVDASFGYQITAVDKNGNESTASDIAFCKGVDIEVNGGTNTVTWSAVPGAVYYNIYRGPTQVYSTQQGYLPIPVGSTFGFIGSAYGTSFPDSGITRDLQQTPPTHGDPFAEGQIEAVTITGQGANQTAITYAITTGTGSGFSAVLDVSNKQLGGVIIHNGGEGYAPGDSIAFNGAGFASGAIEWGSATDVTTGATVTLNGVVWQFVTAVTGPNQTPVTGALSSTLSLLASGLASSGNSSLTVASYSTDGKNLLISYNTAGTGGNAYTLSTTDSAATVSGATLAGGSGTGSAGTHATGNITFAGNPTAGQNIVLNSQTWGFVASGAGANQTNIKGTLALTLTQLATDLDASSNVLINVATYASTTTMIDVTYATIGAAGNAYTLNKGTAGSAVSGPTLSGGTDASGNPTGTLVIGPQSGTYPGVVAFFQQRVFYANSMNLPDTIWATQTDRFTNMDTAIPTSPNDAITASPWTEQIDGIQWLVPMPGGLIAMTGSRAWQVLGQGSYNLNAAQITASTIQAQPQAFNGCSPIIVPIVIEHDVLYVESIGNAIVRDLSWNFWVNIYTGADLTLLSSHLFLYRQLVRWAWARVPYKLLWSVGDDGVMISLTYLKEQEVYGWARHDTQGLVKSVCSVIEPPVNAIYMVVQRFGGGVGSALGSTYMIERMDNRIWQSAEDAYAVDAGISNPFFTPAASLLASSATGAVTFTASVSVFTAANVGDVIRMSGGIATVASQTGPTATGTWVLNPSPGPAGFPSAAAGAWTISTPVTTLKAPHLAGVTTVVGLADGVPIGPLTVGAGPLGTVTLPFTASNVKVGLGFTAQMQTPYLNGPQVTQGGRKVIPSATLRVASSGNLFQFGTNQPDGAAQDPPQLAPTWADMTPVDTQQPTGGQTARPTYTSPAGQIVTPLWTGDIEVLGDESYWISKGQVAVQQTLPVALEITAVMPDVLPGDLPEDAVRPTQGPSQQGGGWGGGQPGQAEPQPPGPWMLSGRARM